MSTTSYYTEEGLRKLQEDLHRLKTVDRPHISQQIADARDKGDLSENAEYHAAKEDQGLLEARIDTDESAPTIHPGEVLSAPVRVRVPANRVSGGRDIQIMVTSQDAAALKTVVRARFIAPAAQ